MGAIRAYCFYRRDLEIMGDENLMTALRRSLEEAEAGKTIPWESVKTRLDL